MNATAFPELVVGRDDGHVSGPWRVIEGTSLRGGASCDLGRRLLEVPFGTDATSRVVRAHELMHARVSPFGIDFGELYGDLSAHALECAEEFRVNTLLARTGFDTGLLRDGSEKAGGRRVAAVGAWDHAVAYLLAVLATGAEKEYLAGIRLERPEWMAPLRAVKKRCLEISASLDSALVASTTLVEGRPQGYEFFSVEIARLLTRAMQCAVPDGAPALAQFRRSLLPGGRRAPSGRFAGLVMLDPGPTRVSVSRGGVTRHVASTSGTVLKYPGRLLTDPKQRAFSHRRRRHGGVVLIDQSGSMDVSPEDLQRLLAAAPDALVMGYSHRPGDLGRTPNMWTLAGRGVVATNPPTGNVGNGVDGPALRWALDARRGSEPVVWVSDGQVTDSNDHPNARLSEECARLVLAHRVRLVRDLEDVTRALGPAGLVAAPMTSFGRVGLKIKEITGM